MATIELTKENFEATKSQTRLTFKTRLTKGTKSIARIKTDRGIYWSK
jgi:hypothetical protein